MICCSLNSLNELNAEEAREMEEKQRAEQAIAPSGSSGWLGPGPNPTVNLLSSDFDPSTIDWSQYAVPGGSQIHDPSETSAIIS